MSTPLKMVEEEIDELADTVERQQAEIARLTDENRKMNKTLAADAIEIFELRAALEAAKALVLVASVLVPTWPNSMAEANASWRRDADRWLAALQPKEGEES